MTAQPYTLNNVHAKSLLDYGDKKNQKQNTWLYTVTNYLFRYNGDYNKKQVQKQNIIEKALSDYPSAITIVDCNFVAKWNLV